MLFRNEFFGSLNENLKSKLLNRSKASSTSHVTFEMERMAEMLFETITKSLMIKTVVKIKQNPTLIEYEFILCFGNTLNDEKSNRLEKMPLAPDVALQR